MWNGWKTIFDGRSNVILQYSCSVQFFWSRWKLVEAQRSTLLLDKDSSVIDFEFRYGGYGYGEGEILTVPVGGTYWNSN